MSIGLAVIHKVLTEGLSLTVLAESGLCRDDFVDVEQDVFDMVHSHFDTFNRLPQLRTVYEETDVRIPDFPDEPLAYWVAAILDRSRGKMLLEGGKEIQNLAGSDDIPAAVARAQELLYAINQQNITDSVVPLHTAFDQALAEHDARQHSSGLRGISFGFPFLDAVSDGAQGGDTVALVGRPGTGKSFLLLWMALQAFKDKKQPLYFTPEMSVLQCGRRLLALETSVPASLVKLGRISHYGRQNIMAKLETLFAEYDHRFDLMQGSLSTSVEDLILRVRDIRPDVLYVDGAYLLRTKRRFQSKWERVAEVAEILKGISLEFDIPVISVYQFNRTGKKNAGIGSIAFSDVIGQLASIVLSIQDDDVGRVDGWDCLQHKLLTLCKGRDGERGQIQILYDMMRMTFTQTQIVEGEGQLLLNSD